MRAKLYGLICVGIGALFCLSNLTFGSGYYNLGAFWKSQQSTCSPLYTSTIGTNTWVRGSNTYGQSATYGTQGVSSSSNVPVARYLPASWVDGLGNFWLFGGLDSGSQQHNDL